MYGRVVAVAACHCCSYLLFCLLLSGCPDDNMNPPSHTDNYSSPKTQIARNRAPLIYTSKPLSPVSRLASLAFSPRHLKYQAVQPKYSGPRTASLGSFANRRFHGWTGDGQKGGEARQQGCEGEHQPPLGSPCYPEAATLVDLRCFLAAG